MLQGIDISHWNEALVKSCGYRWLCDHDFVIMKATEGINYADKYMNTYVNMLYQGKVNPLMGFYHFARPELGNPADIEAEWFISKIYPYIGKALFALDVEAGALKYKDLDNWVNDFCMYFYERTGVKPLIYCSEAECHRFKKASANDCGLWVAKWSSNKPTASKIKPFKIWAIWQNAVVKQFNHSLDLDYFNGTEEAFRAYCKKRVDVDG